MAGSLKKVKGCGAAGAYGAGVGTLAGVFSAAALTGIAFLFPELKQADIATQLTVGTGLGTVIGLGCAVLPAALLMDRYKFSDISEVDSCVAGGVIAFGLIIAAYAYYAGDIISSAEDAHWRFFGEQEPGSVELYKPIAAMANFPKDVVIGYGDYTPPFTPVFG
ncbi:MAG: hypothetical protein LRY54_00610 [Alphaproteobacteria bacterium]|nr:hypothetical protein [Alphaproteobacteria bacterium]